MGFAGIGWALVLIAVPLAIAAMMDPTSRPIVLRRVSGWITSVYSLARSSTRPRVGDVSGQVDAKGQDKPPTPEQVEEPTTEQTEDTILMPPTAFLATAHVAPMPKISTPPPSPTPSPTAPVLCQSKKPSFFSQNCLFKINYDIRNTGIFKLRLKLHIHLQFLNILRKLAIFFIL